MPIIDFDKSKVNKNTSRFLIYYLEKENQNVDEKERTPFFDQDKDVDNPEQIIDELDNNNSKLGKEEDRYYSLYVSPSENELAHIGNDPDKLKSYTRKLMNEYAKNFNKGYTGDDLLYYAKIENNRSYSYNDPEVKSGFVKKGKLKSGNQMHIHIVVSRKTKSKWYKGQRVIDKDSQIVYDDPEFIKRANTAKISPNEAAKSGNHYKIGSKKTGIRSIRRGFNRSAFKQKGEELFDKTFSYNRPIKEKYEYNNLKKNYPEEFLKKYGKQPLLQTKLSPDKIQSDSQKLRYVIKTIEERLPPNSDKPVEVFNKILKENGIKVNRENFYFNGSSFKSQNISSQLLKTTNIIFSAYYFGQRFQKEKKKQEKKEKERNNDKK